MPTNMLSSRESRYFGQERFNKSSLGLIQYLLEKALALRTKFTFLFRVQEIIQALYFYAIIQ